MFVMLIAIAVVIAIAVMAGTLSKKKKLGIISNGELRVVIDSLGARLAKDGGVNIQEHQVATQSGVQGGMYTISDETNSKYLNVTTAGVITLTTAKKTWAYAKDPSKGTAIATQGPNGERLYLAPSGNALVVSPIAYFWTVTL